MTTFSDAIAVANIATLKTTPVTTGTGTHKFKQVTELDSTYDYRDGIYEFEEASTLTEQLPGIVVSTVETGTWVAVTHRIILSTANPIGSAQLPGFEWQNTLTGDRFYSLPDLSWVAIAASGTSAFTTLSSGFTMPAVGSNVTVNVVSSTSFLTGQFVYVATAGNFEIISVPSPTQLQLKNTGATNNAVAATTIATAQKVVPDGQPQPYSINKNFLINGGFQVAQDGTTATITAGNAVPTTSTGYPLQTNWFAYSTGADVAISQINGTDNTAKRLQFTGAASVTAIGVGQRIQSLNATELAGQTATLSVDLSNSLLTDVTYTISYANTANTFGTIATPTKTTIATGIFTVSVAMTRFNVTFACPSNATNGIEILFAVGAQISGTFVIGNVKLEKHYQATDFIARLFPEELALCRRHFERIGGENTSQSFCLMGATSTTIARGNITFDVPKFSVPTVSIAAKSNFAQEAPGATFTALTAEAITTRGATIATTGTYTTGQAFQLRANATLNATISAFAHIP